jgi:hypothetical protein
MNAWNVVSNSFDNTATDLFLAIKLYCKLTTNTYIVVKTNLINIFVNN